MLLILVLIAAIREISFKGLLPGFAPTFPVIGLALSAHWSFPGNLPASNFPYWFFPKG